MNRKCIFQHYRGFQSKINLIIDNIFVVKFFMVTFSELLFHSCFSVHKFSALSIMPLPLTCLQPFLILLGSSGFTLTIGTSSCLNPFNGICKYGPQKPGTLFLSRQPLVLSDLPLKKVCQFTKIYVHKIGIFMAVSANIYSLKFMVKL